MRRLFGFIPGKHVLAVVLVTLMAAMGLAGVNASPADAVEVKHRYYDNYFKNVHTCTSRGKALMKTQPDWITFRCIKYKNDSKFSMDVFVDDGFGCFMPTSRDTSALAGSQPTELKPLCG